MGKRVAFFVLGGTGDLARKKLYPALESLLKKRGEVIKVCALARRKLGGIKTSLPLEFIELDVRSKEAFKKVASKVKELKDFELIFYLALPPKLFEEATINLGETLKGFKNSRKIVVEKPFGLDLESARRLNTKLREYFKEEEIYRIDHYLWKHPVQNILSLRFSNYIFEGIWNKNFIDNVQISALEDVGLEGRLHYYDEVGALRDMVQNHLLQVLTFVAMEPPARMEMEEVRDEKVKVLRSIRKLKVEEVDKFALRAQYRGYRKELGRDSKTETYVALKLYIENFRWEGVPFYIRTGKRLKEKKTQVVVVFKEVPGNFGKLIGCKPEKNKLFFELAPRSRLVFKFQVMSPDGISACALESSMETPLTQNMAYVSLLEDLLEGERSLFIREDETEVAWELVQPILERWKEGDNLYLYEPGSYGPKEAEDFIKRDGRRWLLV